MATPSSTSTFSASETTDQKLTLAELRLAAAGLIAKHQGYLRLIFFNFPNTIRSALYNEEIGWETILRAPPGGIVRINSWGICRDMFEIALVAAFDQHQKICGTRSFEGGPLLVCEREGDCPVMRNQDAWIKKHSLTEDEAKVLFDLLQVKVAFIATLDSEDYTPDNLTALLQRT